MSDDRELTVLFNEVHPGLCRFLECVTGSPQIAHEVAQEAFLRFLESASGSVASGEQRFWLFRVARNLALNELERDRTKQRLGEAAGRFLMREQATPEEDAIRSERQRVILAMLDTLTKDQRSALLLREQEEMSYAEIASVLGISQAKVRVDIFRARERLRNLSKQSEAEPGLSLPPGRKR